MTLAAFVAAGCGGGGGLPGWARWDDSCPAWSPDGKRIAFASSRAESGPHVSHVHLMSWYTYDLYVMNADGRNVRRLTRVTGTTFATGALRSVDTAAPVWSADGRLIIFTLTVPYDYPEFASARKRLGTPYAVKLAGSPRMRRTRPRELVSPPRYPAYDYDKQYECSVRSPRGDQIAFYRPVDTGVGAGGGLGIVGILCVRNAQGKEEQLTERLATSCPSTTVS